MKDQKVIIHSLPLLMSSAYLIEMPDGLVLVDSGIPGEYKKIWQEVQKTGKKLKLILLTHSHFDHFGSAAALRELSGAPIAIHRADADALSRGETPIPLVKGHGVFMQHVLPLAERLLKPPKIEADILLKDGDSFSAFGLEAAFLHTPGHTAGSGCLVLDGQTFIGDLASSQRGLHLQSLYANDWQELSKSFKKLNELPPETIFYPGHGNKSISYAALSTLIKNLL